jgi:ribose transport system ATP-binding protein
MPHGGKPAVRLLQLLGYLSEDRKNEGLALSLSIADNMTMTGFSECSRWGWLQLGEQRSGTKALVDRLGVRARNVDQACGYVVRRQPAKGRPLVALCTRNAEVLLLDEPTRGIDIGSRARVYEIIGELARSGKAVLLVSSYPAGVIWNVQSPGRNVTGPTFSVAADRGLDARDGHAGRYRRRASETRG